MTDPHHAPTRAALAREGAAAIVAVGDELTEGRTENTNAGWLSRRLRRLGLNVTLHLAVPDDPQLMQAAFERAARDARFVLVSGGLGPTLDDVTRDVAAKLAGVALELHAPSLAWIEALFAKFGRAMADNNRRQALFPAGAHVLPNDRGTAPGFRVDAHDASFYFLPGVPRELQRLMEQQVEPDLGPRLPGGAVPQTLQIDTFGLSESEMDRRLADLDGDDLRVGFNFHDGIIEVHLAALATPDAAADRLRAAAAEVRERLGSACYGEGGVTLAATVLEQCRARDVTIAFAESCTGGLCTHLFSQTPGSSAALLGSIVSYANEVKASLLGVPEETLRDHGAVSEATAHAMAEGALRATGADLAASITGIAGPSGGTPEKPVGTVHLAVAGRGDLEALAAHRQVHLHGTRQRIQRYAALSALDLVRRQLGG